MRLLLIVLLTLLLSSCSLFQQNYTYEAAPDGSYKVTEDVTNANGEVITTYTFTINDIINKGYVSFIGLPGTSYSTQSNEQACSSSSDDLYVYVTCTYEETNITDNKLVFNTYEPIDVAAIENFPIIAVKFRKASNPYVLYEFTYPP